MRIGCTALALVLGVLWTDAHVARVSDSELGREELVGSEEKATVEWLNHFVVQNVSRDEVHVSFEFLGENRTFEFERSRGMFKAGATDDGSTDAAFVFDVKKSHMAIGHITFTPQGHVEGHLEVLPGQMFYIAQDDSRRRQLGDGASGVYFAQEVSDDSFSCGDELWLSERRKKKRGLDEAYHSMLNLPRGLKSRNPHTAKLPTPQCYSGQEKAHVFEIAIETDLAFQARYNDNALQARQAIEQAVSQSSQIFEKFFNVRLLIKSLVINSQASSTPAQLRSCSGKDLLSYLRIAGTRAGNLPASRKSGHYHLLSGCKWAYLGIARMNVACGSEPAAVTTLGRSEFTKKHFWKTFVHEVAHIFNADHSFENGQSKTGGLMDYGDGKFVEDKTYGFRLPRQNEMCQVMRRIKTSRCKYFYPVGNGGSDQCGNGVLEPSEECECANGSTNCRGCNKCKKSNKKDQCSAHWTTRFASGDLVLEVQATSDAECCKGNMLMDATTSCKVGNSQVGYCALGRCVDPCRENDKNFQLCGTKQEEQGCRQYCRNPNANNYKRCFWSYRPDNTGLDKAYGNMPDGALCTKGRADGLCMNGECTVFTAAPTRRPTSPTRPPTPYPTRIPTTAAPTERPTDRPTMRPTKPTRRPTTPKPTKARPTKKPTQQPTPKPTRRPTTPRPTTPKPTKARPTKKPTQQPTPQAQSGEPTVRPTTPTSRPTKKSPTKKPTRNPTPKPTKKPTKARPTKKPTQNPTPKPTKKPTPFTKKPTIRPTTKKPTTSKPSPSPTLRPTMPPTAPEGRERLPENKHCADLDSDECCKYYFPRSVEEGGGACMPAVEFTFFARSKVSCRAHGWIINKQQTAKMGTCE